MVEAPRLGDRFELTRVAQRTFAAIGQNLGTFAVLALVLGGVPAAFSTVGMLGLLGGLAGSLGQTNATPFLSIGAGALIASVGWVVSVVCRAILQGALIYGAASYLNGRRASLGDCFGAGVRRCLPLIGLLILAGIAIVVGFFLFIVPGVMMAVAWVVIVPVLVVERSGVFAAFGRSADLTRGHRWPIFGLIVIYAIAAGIIQQVLIGVVMSSFGGFGGAGAATATAMVQLPLSAALSVAFSVISSVGTASIYYELRSTREGAGPEALAAVFD